jgi:hypothetical protein
MAGGAAKQEHHSRQPEELNISTTTNGGHDCESTGWNGDNEGLFIVFACEPAVEQQRQNKEMAS